MIGRKIADLPFDGIICIGGEDCGITTAVTISDHAPPRTGLAGSVRQLIAVRMPSLKEEPICSAHRPQTEASRAHGAGRKQLCVFSPAMVPWQARSRAGRCYKSMRRARRYQKPLLWIHCPAGAALIDEIPAAW
jgi:hypothetical protein